MVKVPSTTTCAREPNKATVWFEAAEGSGGLNQIRWPGRPWRRPAKRDRGSSCCRGRERARTFFIRDGDRRNQKGAEVSGAEPEEPSSLIPPPIVGSMVNS